MKSLITLFALTAAISFTSLNAALPPLYESLNEYRALLNHEELANTLGSAEYILDIQRNDTGFIITTYNYCVQVDCIHEHLNQPGPAKFHFIVHELIENQ